MKMAKVKECDAIACSYNVDNLCHAIAITVGDESRPLCDTICQFPIKGGSEKIVAGVRACKVDRCIHNRSLRCTCSEIKLGYKGTQLHCLGFSLE